MSVQPGKQQIVLGPIEYAHIVAPRRPTALTALGVMSIIIGALSTFGSFGSMATGVGYLLMSAIPVQKPTPPAAPAAISRPIAVAFPLNMFHIDPSVSVLMICTGGLSLLVGIMLLIAGILVLMDRSMGWRLHRIYPLVKIPLIVIAGLTTYWMYSNLFSNMVASNPAGAPMPHLAQTFGLIEAIFISVFSLSYPVAVLIVLATKTFKNYAQTFQAIR